jgi:predicted RNA-binding protein with PUA-like domain
MNYFLAKTEPGTYSIDDLERDRHTVWDGVTNAQAVRAIREMRPGDLRIHLSQRRCFQRGRAERC